MNINDFHRKLAKSDEYPIYIKIPFLTFSSWLFQGIFYMDRTERNFKIFMDLIIFLPLFILFNQYFNTIISIFIAIVASHTINWIFNGQIFVLFKNLKLIKTDANKFNNYIIEIKNRAVTEKGISIVATFGSLSRKELKETSDLDIRIVRKKGEINGLTTSIFILKERTRAFFSRFPLDIYLLDNPKKLEELGEKPIFLYIKDDLNLQINRKIEN